MKYFLKVLFTPTVWIQVPEYSKDLDKFLNQAIEEPFYGRDEYEVTLDGKRLWIANYPYAGFCTGPTYAVDFRPSRRTILKLGDKFFKQYGFYPIGFRI